MTEKPTNPTENGLSHLRLWMIQEVYLNEVRDGVNAVLDTFQEVLKEETELCDKWEDSAEVYQERLKKIETECWSRIRNDYLSKADVLSGEEPPKCMENLMFGLTQKLDKIKDGLEIKLQGILQKEEDYKTEIRSLKQQLGEERYNIVELKWQRQRQKEESNGAQHSKEVLAQQLEEKRGIIAELQRSSIVQLWGKEKEKLLEEAKQREEQLKSEFTELKQAYDKLRERTTKRIRDLEEKLKLSKMKTLDPKAPKSEWEAENDILRRQLYFKDKDATKVEQEIVKQQKLYAGCVKGIKRDFKIITERQEDGRIATEDIRKLKAILEAILKGTCEGRLEQTKADLPLHYFVVDEEVTGHPMKRLSKLKLQPPLKLEAIAESSSESQQSQRGQRVWFDKASNIERGTPSTSGSRCRSWFEKPKSPRGFLAKPFASPKPSSTPRGSLPMLNGSNGTLVSNQNGSKPMTMPVTPDENGEVKQVKDENPDLLDDDGNLDVERVKMCFPHMTEEEIKEHHKQFENYDTNGDHTLDFVEMLQAIRGTVGDYFKPRQIKEAIAEIDVDRSESVDFYEYLRISALLLKKAGKSEIFRSGLVKDASNSMSRVCSIQ